MLYRKQRGPLNPGLLAAISLVALLLGFGAGRLSAPRSTLADLLSPSLGHLRQASGALDIVGLEYARAASGNAPSLQASLRAARQAGAELADATPLRQLYPGAAVRAARALSTLEGAVQRKASDAEVQRLLGEARTALAGLSVAAP